MMAVLNSKAVMYGGVLERVKTGSRVFASSSESAPLGGNSGRIGPLH